MKPVEIKEIVKLYVTLLGIIPLLPTLDLVGAEVFPAQAGHQERREQNDEQKLAGIGKEKEKLVKLYISPESSLNGLYFGTNIVGVIKE